MFVIDFKVVKLKLATVTKEKLFVNALENNTRRSNSFIGFRKIKTAFLPLVFLFMQAFNIDHTSAH